MGFNNYLMRRKFEEEWEKLRKEYAAAGMDEASIEEMYRFDLTVFNSNRRYLERKENSPWQEFADDGHFVAEGNPGLLARYRDVLSVMPKETYDGRRYGWVDDIDSPELASALHKLSAEDIELLTLHVFDGYGVTEIAAMLGVAQPTISKKLTRIKKFIKKF